MLYPVSDKYAFEDNGDKTDKEDSENQQEKTKRKKAIYTENQELFQKIKICRLG